MRILLWSNIPKNWQEIITRCQIFNFHYLNLEFTAAKNLAVSAIAFQNNLKFHSCWHLLLTVSLRECYFNKFDARGMNYFLSWKKNVFVLPFAFFFVVYFHWSQLHCTLRELVHHCLNFVVGLMHFKLSSFAWQDAKQVSSMYGTSAGVLHSFAIIVGRLCLDTWFEIRLTKCCCCCFFFLRGKGKPKWPEGNSHITVES